MAVRVRDLEIALVLAREMKAAAERSVDASLRLDQLQEVFGVDELDRAERARIQTALQMAGLEPFPSLLEAEPSAPIRFGASKAAAAGATAQPPAPPEEPAATEAAAAFPTVGQFARSKLLSRRFGVRRGDHGEGDAPPREPVEPPVEANGHMPEEAELDIDETHIHEQIEAEEEDAAEAVMEAPVGEEEEVAEELLDEEPVAEEAHLEPEAPEPIDEREYIPLVPQEPVEYEAPEEPAPIEPEPQPAGARAEEVVAVLLPAVAIPVIVTSIAGWRFGLPFVALTVIASGWLLSRRARDGEKRGLFASVRRSPAAATALKVTAIVTVVSVVASVLLVSLGDSSSSTKKAAAPAKKAQQPVASKPVTPPKPPATTTKKKAAKRHSHATAPQPTTPAGPPPDPATQGLVRVPPSSSSTPSQSTTPSGTPSGGTP